MLVLNTDRGERVVFIFAYIYNPHHLFDHPPTSLLVAISLFSIVKSLFLGLHPHPRDHLFCFLNE